MPSVTTSKQVAAPPERVWAVASDPSRFPELVVPTDRMLQVPDGPLAAGSVYREYGGIPPFKGESEWRVTVFDPPRRQVHSGDDGKMRIEVTIEIEPAPGGSRLAQTVELRPRPWLKPLTALVRPLFMRRRTQRAMDETSANFKRAAEASPEA